PAVLERPDISRNRCNAGTVSTDRYRQSEEEIRESVCERGYRGIEVERRSGGPSSGRLSHGERRVGRSRRRIRPSIRQDEGWPATILRWSLRGRRVYYPDSIGREPVSHDLYFVLASCQQDHRGAVTDTGSRYLSLGDNGPTTGPGKANTEACARP